MMNQYDIEKRDFSLKMEGKYGNKPKIRNKFSIKNNDGGALLIKGNPPFFSLKVSAHQ